MKVGDHLLCIKEFCCFVKGSYARVYSISVNSVVIVSVKDTTITPHHLSKRYLKEHFYVASKKRNLPEWF